MKDKLLGDATTLKQCIDGKNFFVHCQNDDCYVKMSSNGLIQPVDDHVTYYNINGEWKLFKYIEPISCHNHAIHWVDDVNNCCHDPIALEDVWGTKWWPTQQLTFILSAADVNAINSQACARKEKKQNHNSHFALAEQMNNQLGINLPCPPSPPVTRNKRKVF